MNYALYLIFILLALLWRVFIGFSTKAVILNKGYTQNWFWWGFFLGIFAFIYAVAYPDKQSNFSNKHYLNEFEEWNRTKNLIISGGWKCRKCGKVNSSYTGTCGCGMTKTDLPKDTASDQSKSQSSEEKWEEILALKAYKELLDSRLISQAEYDNKKKEILKL